jgi:hypothetical protein
MNSFCDFFQNFKKLVFLKIQISKIFWMALKRNIFQKLVCYISYESPEYNLQFGNYPILLVLL